MTTLLNALTELQSQELQIGVIKLFDSGDGVWDLDNLIDELRGDSPDNASFCASDAVRVVWLTENKFNIKGEESDTVYYYGEVTPTTADLQV